MTGICCERRCINKYSKKLWRRTYNLFKSTVTQALGFSIFNGLILATELNRTLNLQRLISNNSSPTYFPWLSPTNYWSQFSFPYPLLYAVVIPFSWVYFFRVIESESHFTTDGQSAFLSWNKRPSGAYDQISITVRQLRVFWHGAISLTRGRACHLHLPLAVASTVILGSESRVTQEYILLSQNRDFPLVVSYDSQATVEVLERATTQVCTLKSKSKSHYDWRSVSVSVLVSSHVWGSWPDIC
jgi:hypothetical protein